MPDKPQIICDQCGKNPATVHFTEISNQKMRKSHLCGACAETKGVHRQSDGKTTFTLKDLVAGLAESGHQVFKEKDNVCSVCGYRYEQFRESGRLGCSECYVSFEEQLKTILKKIHGSLNHCGRVPSHVQVSAIGMIERLRKEMKSAVEIEDFERAADIRNQIRRLEASLAKDLPDQGEAK